MLATTEFVSPGIGDLQASDYLASVFINSDGTFNLSMAGLVLIGGYLGYNALFGKEASAKRAQKRIDYHNDEIRRLRKKTDKVEKK